MGSGNCKGAVPVITFHALPLEVSDLYKACAVGNVEEARKLLADMPFILRNAVEPNGSTALHAASANGHADIVHLLVQEYGVICNRRNAQDLTAYQVAANDEIRQIFHRPSIGNPFSLVTQDMVQTAFVMFFPASRHPAPRWINSTSGWLKVRTLQNKRKKNKVIENNRLLNVASKVNNGKISEFFSDKRDVQILKKMIDKFITPADKQYQKACYCLSQFEITGDVEHLLTIYTLQTPFYSKVGGPQLCYTLLRPLNHNLDALKERHYQGLSYRGLLMTKEDLLDYEDAMKQEIENKKETIITLASFASTSIRQDVARCFADPSGTTGKISVIITCTFPKLCDTAIKLYKVSESARCISNFEDEQEVLLYPGTMFRVTNIDTTSEPSTTHMHLTNVMPEFRLEVEIFDRVINVVQKKAQDKFGGFLPTLF